MPISSEDAAQQPLVSVLTPSFGQAKWLADNLSSVARQTYPAIEQIVMDGGSTDGSVDLLQRHARPGLAWRSEPDEGQSHALNKAFEMSRGDIIGWLNSDDAYFSATAVAEAVRVFQAKPDVAVVYGHGMLANATGLLLQALWVPPYSRSLLRLHDFIVQPAAFIRRNVLGDQFVDQSFDYTMDYELWLRLAQDNRFQRVDRILAIDRHHGARKSHVLAEVGRADHARLERRYGVAGGPVGRVGRKTWKIASRLIGTSLIRSALKETVVFDAERDAGGRLLVRQVGIPRAAMETGDDPADPAPVGRG